MMEHIGNDHKSPKSQYSLNPCLRYKCESCATLPPVSGDVLDASGCIPWASTWKMGTREKLGGTESPAPADDCACFKQCCTCSGVYGLSLSLRCMGLLSLFTLWATSLSACYWVWSIWLGGVQPLCFNIFNPKGIFISRILSKLGIYLDEKRALRSTVNFLQINPWKVQSFQLCKILDR